MDRKAELERKKERLRQMREEKERRKREKEKLDSEAATISISSSSQQSGASSTRGTSPASSTRGGHDVDISVTIDKVLADCGIAPVKSVLDSMSSAASGSSSLGTAAGVGSSLEPNLASMGGLSMGSTTGDHLAAGGASGITSPRIAKKELSVVTVQSTNIAPKVSY